MKRILTIITCILLISINWSTPIYGQFIETTKAPENTALINAERYERLFDGKRLSEIVPLINNADLDDEEYIIKNLIGQKLTIIEPFENKNVKLPILAPIFNKKGVEIERKTKEYQVCPCILDESKIIPYLTEVHKIYLMYVYRYSDTQVNEFFDVTTIKDLDYKLKSYYTRIGRFDGSFYSLFDEDKDGVLKTLRMANKEAIEKLKSVKSELYIDSIINIYNANICNKGKYIISKVYKDDSNRARNLLWHIRRLDTRRDNYNFVELKDMNSDITLNLPFEYLLEYFEIDSFREWQKHQEMLPYDITEEPYVEWLARYWDNPKFHDKLASQEYFDCKLGELVKVVDIVRHMFDNKYWSEYELSNGQKTKSLICTEEIRALNDLYAGEYITKNALAVSWVLNSKNFEHIDRCKVKIEKILLSDKKEIQEEVRGDNEYNLVIKADNGIYIPLNNMNLPLEHCEWYERNKETEFTEEETKTYDFYDVIAAERNKIIAESNKIQKRQNESSKRLENERQAAFVQNKKLYGENIALSMKNGKVLPGMDEAMIRKALNHGVGRGELAKDILDVKDSGLVVVRYRSYTIRVLVTMKGGKIVEVLKYGD